MKGPCPTIPISTCVREQCKHIRILCLHHYDGYQREIAYAQHVHCNLCPLTGMIDPGIAFLGRQVFTASRCCASAYPWISVYALCMAARCAPLKCPPVPKFRAVDDRPVMRVFVSEGGGTHCTRGKSQKERCRSGIPWRYGLKVQARKERVYAGC